MKIKLIKFKSVRSTNDTAIKLIKKNLIIPILIFTENQTKGRGTMGKKWISIKGNLFLSILFKINLKKFNLKQLTFLNVYLVRKVLKKYSKKTLKIKWPNDILIENKKLCGILQELVYFKEETILIVGIGVNTYFNPNIKNQKTTSLKMYQNKKFNNKRILMEIKKIYEKFIIEISRSNYTYLKKKYKN